MQKSGQSEPAFPGVTLFRGSAPSTCYLTSVEPCFTVFAQGTKRINIGGEDYICGEKSFFVSGIDVPTQSQIIEASEAMPPLAMRLRLDMPKVREVLSRDDLPEVERSTQRRGLAAGCITGGLLSSLLRAIELLDTQTTSRSFVT
jgi:hypothetical protein